MLLIPQAGGAGDQGASRWRVTLVTFVLTLVALAATWPSTPPRRRSLAERAAANVLAIVPAGGRGPETGDAANDLVVRHAWIPSFNIEYYLGLDGISLRWSLLTGLVSVLACLASWNIEKQVKGYCACSCCSRRACWASSWRSTSSCSTSSGK